MTALVADEHVLQTVVRGLRDRGLDVEKVDEVGLDGATDQAVLNHCRARGRVLLTNDDDFLDLGRRGDHPGIIFQTTQFAEPGELLRAVVQLVDTVPEESFAGGVFYIP